MWYLQRLLCCVVITQLIVHSGTALEIIAGSRAPCTNEGEEVDVKSIRDMSCFRCICKNGFVECSQEKCPVIENCYVQMPKKGCCSRCQGCWYGGQMRASHTEWRASPEEGGPCRVMRCEAGVLTTSRLQCYTPCKQPQKPLPGQCCPTCHEGCIINKQRISEGRDVTIPEDPCLKCLCKDGQLACAKRACLVLACPRALQRTPPGECCPHCVENKAAKLLPIHGANKPCILGTEYHYHGASFALDACTSCACSNGTSVCERRACPVTECAPTARLPPAPGTCCPRCPDVQEVSTACVVAGITYQDGESWQWDACKSCTCKAGEPRCVLERCPALTCARDQREHKPAGACCARCVDKDGVCSVFGDPHYKTFDGKFYSFQGACKYLLTADCANDTFSIRISNDAKGTKFSSWTKNVALKMGDIKINLGQKLRVKVDGQRIQLPFRLANDLAEVIRLEDKVSVTTKLGIQLLWDGEGFLEVTASSGLKNKLCGLCGNFNSVVRDDLTTRKGIVLRNASNEDVRKFGASWRVGGRKACTRLTEKPYRDKGCNKTKRRLASRMCKYLNTSNAFAACRHKLNPQNYYTACRRDMCECPGLQCYCASLHAYAHECGRLDAAPVAWRAEVACGAGAGMGGREGVLPWLVSGRPPRHRNERVLLPHPDLPALPRHRRPPPALHDT